MVMLQPKDIQDMGVTLVGDRIGIQKELRAFKGQARLADRNKVLCQYKQAYPGSDCQRAMYDSVWKCCFPREADMYILASTLLKIRKYHVRRLVGAVKCGGCLGGDWDHDAIPLDKITDVDTMTTTVGVGMFKTAKCHIFLSAMAGGDATSQVARVEKHTLFVEESDGEKFADEIRHPRRRVQARAGWPARQCLSGILGLALTRACGGLHVQRPACTWRMSMHAWSGRAPVVSQIDH
eukprot:UN0184